MLHRILSEIRYRWRSLIHRGEVERELDEELRFHLAREAEKHAGTGVPRGEAERRARAAFGALEGMKDETRDAHGLVFLETLVQDLRYAVRGLRARPAFTSGVVLTLALGIGANAAMFGIVDRLLFRAPPMLRDADAVHRVYARWTSNGERQLSRALSFPAYLELATASRTIDDIAAFQTRSLAAGDGADVQEVQVTLASASYFRLFDARPVLGRFFTAAEDSIPSGAPVVVLGHAFWLARYGGRTDVLGQTLRIDRTVYTIIGVAPEGFVGVSDQGVPAAYIPITSYAFALRGPSYTTRQGWSWLRLVVHVRPGATLAGADAELTDALVRNWRTKYASDPGWGSVEATQPVVELGPVQVARGPEAGRDAGIVTWVGGVAFIVLLIACANVANLLLSRAVTRRREIAMRLALGVSRARLMRQLLTESLVLSAAGGLAGLLLARWGGATLRVLFLPGESREAVLTDPRTLLFALLLTLVAAVLTGLAPAVHASRADVAGALKAGTREGTYQRSRLRRLLLVAQATLSVVLLVGAGLFVRSLQHVRGFRLGYDVDPVLFATGELRGTRLTDAEGEALLRRMLTTAQRLPGVTHAAVVASVPFWSNEGRGLYVAGIDSVRTLGQFVLQAGTPDYFATMGTRILRGRAFGEADRAGAPPVVVVSEGMARTLWPGKDPLGQCLRINSPTAPCTTVIGVAEEVRLRSLTDTREFSYYVPAAQLGEPLYPYLLARVTGRAADQVAALRRALQAEMPGAAYVSVVPLQSLIDPNLRAWRFGATMFTAFGALALLLAAIGLYSSIAYDVAQRTPELGVRVALGASTSRVMRLVVFGGLRLVAAGVALGTLFALWAGRWVEPLLFQESARDPGVFVLVASLLLAVALVALAVPARRAARVDPNAVLRAD